jgi:hypothetical protein
VNRDYEGLAIVSHRTATVTVTIVGLEAADVQSGANVIRAAIVDAGGATDFCARLLDENDRPIKMLRTTLTARWRR